MRSDIFDGLLIFTRVAEKRSFTAAAAELGITTAAVSWNISRLEARVGVSLLTRTTRSVRLTDAGKLFLEQAQGSVSCAEAAVQAAQRLGVSPKGLLRLSIPYVAQTLIEPILKGFAVTCPDVELELVFEDRFVDIVAEGYDAGIRIGKMIAHDMVAVRLTDPSPLTVVGSPAYFAERGKPQYPDQLEDHACINVRLAGGAIYRWAFVDHQASGGPRAFSIDVKGPLIVNGPATCLAAAVAGVGLTYNIRGVVEPLMRQGLLEPCLDAFMPESAGFFIFFPSRKHMPPKLRAFIDFARKFHEVSTTETPVEPDKQ
ncbi:LysR family transcriptional regulator [Pseudomonas citri]|uniref:LysR family transcriptional regulator n=1 Tax=Pseudomonas citri TaxID=2978349 RepID=UPI0021B64978|nr:LysR family transcriptional regulator [Pseudomonas citri]